MEFSKEYTLYVINIQQIDGEIHFESSITYPNTIPILYFLFIR